MTKQEEIAALTAKVDLHTCRVPISDETLALIGAENYSIVGNTLSINNKVSFAALGAFSIERQKFNGEVKTQIVFANGKQTLKYTFIGNND